MLKVKKILVIRNDKIGDFILALPAIKAIKKAFPHAEITALVPSYTQEIATAFTWIDRVIIDSKKQEDKKMLAKELQKEGFDAAICLFSDTYNATLVRLAKIPIRVAPATKWIQFLYTHTLRQRRSQSLKPEFDYNLDLARYFIEVLKGSGAADSDTAKSDTVESNTGPMFFYDADVLFRQLVKLEKVGITKERKHCFIHPVTGGSSNTLLLEQWAVLINFLDTLDTFHFVITAGPGEASTSQALVDLMKDEVSYISLYDKNDGISDFMCSIATADLFIAGSTGPLHIAGAMNVPTIGFYPQKRSSTSLRWKTLNTEGRWLPLTPNEQEDLLTNMDVKRVFEMIKIWYLNLTEKD